MFILHRRFTLFISNRNRRPRVKACSYTGIYSLSKPRSTVREGLTIFGFSYGVQLIVQVQGRVLVGLACAAGSTVVGCGIVLNRVPVRPSEVST